MKYEIREINPLSFARMTGIAFAIIALLGIITYFIVFSIVDPYLIDIELGTLWWILGIIVVLYLIGFAFGLLFTVIYNAVASGSKGIELEIDLAKKEEEKIIK